MSRWWLALGIFNENIVTLNPWLGMRLPIYL
jgi:hypothetical protein